MALNIEIRFQDIKRRIAAAMACRPSHLKSIDVRLVAVSKFQSIDSIVSLYERGQRLFGENYIQELMSKSSDSRITSQCPDIEWRFIGHLQTNKANQLSGVKRLVCLETIDSSKVAKALNKAFSARPLQVMVEVNTSGEKNKNGVSPQQVLSLVDMIDNQCPQLHVQGLMTIGRFGHDVNSGANPDFEALVKCGEELRQKRGKDIELSFGMSDDFEHAISMGSNEVRIGSALFGDRNKQ